MMDFLKTIESIETKTTTTFNPFLTKRSICGILSMNYIKYVVNGDALVLSHIKYIYKKHLHIWILAKVPKTGIFAFQIREQI